MAFGLTGRGQQVEGQQSGKSDKTSQNNQHGDDYSLKRFREFCSGVRPGEDASGR